MFILDFTVDSVTKKIEVPVSLVSKRRYQWLRYNSQVPKHGVAISFLGLPQLTEKNILLFNAGPSVNTDAYLEDKESLVKISLVNNGSSQKFETKLTDFYLTDIKNTLDKGVEQPLFFYHLMANNDGTVITGYAPGSVKILDKDMNEVDKSLWQEPIAEEDTDGNTVYKVYHSLEFRFDQDSNQYVIYYLHFRSDTGEEVFKLLESRRVFDKLYDINDTLSTASKTYQVYPTSAGVYEVVTRYLGAINNDLYFKPALTGQIKAFKPANVTHENSWQLRFTNGGFIAQVEDEVYRYAIPEFNRQAFYQNRISERIRETSVINGLNEGRVLGAKLVQSLYNPLVVDSARGMYLEVIILDKDGVAYDGYTNNPYKLYWSNPEETYTIQLRDFSRMNNFSFNAETGFIYLPYEIKEIDRVLINGTYRENYFEYDEIEVNPVYNRSVLDKKLLFYLNPQKVIDRLLILDDPYKDRGLYHLLVDENGLIIDYPEDTDGSPLDPDLKKTGSTDLKYPDLYQFQAAFPEKIIITECYIGRLADPSDVQEIDVRIPGGGLKEDFDPSAWVDVEPSLLWASDKAKWDGVPYPGQSATLVELPQSLMVSGGGSLELEDIKSVVKKHMAMGTYPVIRFYGSIPRILWVWAKIDGSQRLCSLAWEGVGIAESYRVYQIISTQRYLLDETTQTYATNLSLTPQSDNLYRVMIVPIHDDEEGLPSDVFMCKAG